MENQIVYKSGKKLFVASTTIAEMLDVEHNKLLRTIEAIVDKQKNSRLASRLFRYPQVFKESTFKNKMNRTYKMYELNESAYMKLAMQLSGYEKAEAVQDSIIEAFQLMKDALLQKENASWLSARKQGKAIRKAETDVIKEFVDYATAQGSKNAHRYYANITKMTNKALELLIQVPHGEKLRDLATITELGFIQMLEHRAMQAIEYGMSENLPYKYIYKHAKEEVNKLADQLNYKRSIK